MKPLIVTVNPSNIDQKALIITIVGYVTVFLVLAAMVLLFIEAHRVQDYFAARRRKREAGKAAEEQKEIKKITGDENAAICTALYLYFTELHDQEKYVMTVKKVSRAYSPWSSKIYGLFNTFKH